MMSAMTHQTPEPEPDLELSSVHIVRTLRVPLKPPALVSAIVRELGQLEDTAIAGEPWRLRDAEIEEDYPRTLVLTFTRPGRS